MTAIWIGIIGGWAITLVSTAYLAGQLRERFQTVIHWKERDAEPRLEDHESRLTTLESVTPFGPLPRRKAHRD